MAVLKVLFYLIVLILVLILAYVTTRMLGRGMNGRQQSGDMKILDRLAVGRDSYLMIVDVQGRILLVGVSPAGITRLEELETYERKSPAEVSPDFASVFTEQLKTLVKKDGRPIRTQLIRQIQFLHYRDLQIDDVFFYSNRIIGARFHLYGQ